MKTLTLALLCASLPTLAADRPIELYCTGQLTAIRKHAALSVILDLSSNQVIATGLPVFQPVLADLSVELHQYTFDVPGYNFALSRADMRFTYSVEGVELSGTCQHAYPLL